MLTNMKCFNIMDSDSNEIKLKIKESLHIKWNNPDLNMQVRHLNLQLFAWFACYHLYYAKSFTLHILRCTALDGIMWLVQP